MKGITLVRKSFLEAPIRAVRQSAARSIRRWRTVAAVAGVLGATAGTAYAVITVPTATVGNGNAWFNDGGNHTWTGFSFTAGANGMLAVTIGGEGNGYINAVSWDADGAGAGASQSLIAAEPTLASGQSNTVFSSIWYLVAPSPSVGASGTLSYTLSAGVTRTAMGALYATGIDQTTPLVADLQPGAIAQTVTTGTVSAAAGGLVIATAASSQGNFPAPAGSFGVITANTGAGTNTSIYTNVESGAGRGSGSAAAYMLPTSGGTFSAAWDTGVGGQALQISIASFAQYIALITTNWTGGSLTTNNWTDPDNWGGTAPVAGSPLVFAGSTRPTPNNDFTANTAFAGLTFNSGAGSFTIGGNAIKLGGDIINNSLSLQTISLDLALQQATNLNAAAGDLALGGALSGGFGVTKLGAGTVTLSGANSYTGNTTVSAGKLQLSGSGTLGSNANATLTINTGAILDLGGKSVGVGILTGTGGTIINNASATAATLTVGNNNMTGSWSGVIADNSSGTGTVALVKAGSSTLTLTGVNTFTGGFAINAGKVTAGAAGSLGAGTVTVADNATLATTLANAFKSGALGNPDLPITLTAGATTGAIVSISSDTGSLTLGGNLTVSGAGTATLYSIKSSNGPTDGGNALTRTFGTLSIGSQTLLTDDKQPESQSWGGGIYTMAFGAGTLTGSPTFDLRWRDGTGNQGTGKVSVAGFSSGGSAYTVTKIGKGTLMITAASDYTGGTAVNAGTVQSSASGALGTGAVTVASGATVNAYAAYALGDTSLTLASGATLNSGFNDFAVANVFQSNAAGHANLPVSFVAGSTINLFNNGTTYGGNFTISGTGTAALNVNTASNGPYNGTWTFGTLSIGAQTLKVDSPVTNRAWTGSTYNAVMGATTLTGSPTFNVSFRDGVSNEYGYGNLTLGTVSDGGSGYGITKTGTGRLILSGVNNYSGENVVQAGYLQGQNTGTTNTVAGVFGSSSTLKLNGGNLALRANGSGSSQTIAAGYNVLVTGNGGVDVDRYNGSNTGSTFTLGTLSVGARANPADVFGGSTFAVSGANNYTASFTSTTLTGNTTFNLANSASFVNLGAIGEAGGYARSLSKSGSGWLTLAGLSSYSGGTNVSAGTLAIGATGNAGANIVGNNLTVTNDAKLGLYSATNIGSNQTVAVTPMAAPTTSYLNGVAPMVVVNYDGALPTITSTSSGVLQLAVNYASSLNQANTGKLFLGSSGTTSYTGTSLGAGSDDVYRLSGGGNTLTVPNGVLVGTGKQLLVGIATYNGAGTANGTGTVVLEGNNSYTGATTVNAGSTLAVQRGTGSIAGSSAINVVGGSLQLLNSPAFFSGGDNSNNRIGNSTPVTLERGSFQINGNFFGAGSKTTETIGTLTYKTNATTTVYTEFGTAILTATDWVRSGKATGLVRGDNLGINGLGAPDTGSNVFSQLLLTTPTIGGIGTNTANTANGQTTTKNLTVVPWLLADNSRGGNGSSFATYDTGVGIRPLRAAETVVLSGLTLGATDDYNVRDTSSTSPTFAASVVANSINLAPTAGINYTGAAGLTLTSASGGLALTTNQTVTVQTWDAINLGTGANPEAVIITGTGTLNLNSDINPGQNYALTKGGGGTLVLNGAKTYTGAVTVNAGSLYLRGSGQQASTTVNGGTLVLDAAAGAGALGSASTPISINASGVLSVNNNFWGGAAGTGPAWGGGTINLNDGGQIQLWGGGGNKFEFTNLVAVTGNAYIYQDSGGGSGNKTRIGDVSMSAGAMLTTLRSNGSTNGFGMGAVTLNEASASGNATFNVLANSPDTAHATDIHFITGTGGIIKRGTGELWLGFDNYFVNAEGNTASSYTGDTRIEGGKLRIGMTNALPTGTTLYVNSGATFDLSSGGAENNDYNFNQQVAGINDGSAGGGTISANGTDANLGTTRTLTVGGAGSYNFSGSIVDTSVGNTASLALAINGGGTQILTGASTYTGGTTVSSGSTLQLGNGTTRNGSIAGNVSVDGTSFLTFNNPLAQTYAGAISGSGTFAKNSAGQLVLSGANTFGGTLAVNTGELDLAGNTSTLLTVNTGTTFSPGAVAGDVTVGGLAFSGVSTYKWEVSGTGIDHIQVNGDLSVNGTPTLKLINVDNTPPPPSVAIIDYTGNLPASAAWAIDYSATSAGTVSHWTDGTGAWDNNANWDQQGWGGGSITYDTLNKKVMLTGVTASTTTPGGTTDVVIAPAGTAAVSGSSAPRTIASLTLGDSSANTHSLTLQAGGALTATGAVTVNPSGSLTATAAGLSAALLTVTGAADLGSALSIATINSSGTTTFSSGATGTIPVLNVTGGTTTIAGGANPAITSATVSGGGNLTAGGGTLSALTLQSGYSGTVNINAGAALSGPVTVPSGTFNYNNAGTLSSLTVSGGAATLNGGATVSSATVAGSGNLTASNSTLSALTVQSGYAGTTTVNAGAVLNGPVVIPSGTFNLNNTNTMTSLTVTGGTVNTGAGATAATVDLSAPGTGIVNTGGNNLAVTSQLKTSDGATFAYTAGGGGTSFGIKGSNVASSVNTLTLSGGTVQATLPPTATGTNLNAGGTALPAGSYTLGGNALTITGGGGDFWGGTEQGYFVYKPVAKADFDVSVYVSSLTGNGGDGGWTKAGLLARADVSTNNVAMVLVAQTTGNGVAIQRCDTSQWGSLVGGGAPHWLRLTYAAATDVFTGYYSTDPGTTPPTIWSGGSTYTATMPAGGFDLGIGITSHNNGTSSSANFTNVTFFPASNLNWPTTTIAATNSSTFNLPSGSADVFGSLNLSGIGTALTLSGATSVTFNGNVTGTGTASVLLSGPSLILAGSNIDAIGASDVLTLPAMTLAAATVNINASGAGTVVFSGATTFSSLSPSPSLVISGGLLQVDATLGSAAVTVTGTGHLGGHGTISGPIIIAAGGSLAPGDSPGVLTVTSTLTLNYGALLDFDLNTPNATPGTGGNDLLVVGNTLTLNPGLTLDVTPGVDFGKGLYHLISFGSLTDNSNGFQNWTGTDPSGNWGYAFSKTAGSIDVTVTLIPEPASLALLVLSGLYLVRRRVRGA